MTQMQVGEHVTTAGHSAGACPAGLELHPAAMPNLGTSDSGCLRDWKCTAEGILSAKRSQRQLRLNRVPLDDPKDRMTLPHGEAFRCAGFVSVSHAQFLQT